MNQTTKAYDLEKRTSVFGANIITLCKSCIRDTISIPIIGQLVRSGTSVGANYMEANGASSKSDFRNKIYICKNEIQETKHWLTMLSSCFPEKQEEIDKLSQEAHELNLIFQKITHSLKN